MPILLDLYEDDVDFFFLWQVRTQRLRDNPKIKGLRSTLSQINPGSLKNLGLVVQASVGTIEAPDETPFVG